jgi:predicted metal-dependent enzyme (double-stranded beta helix superfamily)
MFDLDGFIADCQAAIAEHQPRLAIKQVLDRAVADPTLPEALPPTRAEIVKLYVDEDLTILKVVWTPGMSVAPHDHRMWAAIGVYTGAEDNEFYRRDQSTLTASGGRTLRPGDVCLLGDDVIHGVTNPSRQHAGAIHVYGGDLFATPRSEWRGDPLTEEPNDPARTIALFEAANTTTAS